MTELPWTDHSSSGARLSRADLTSLASETTTTSSCASTVLPLPFSQTCAVAPSPGRFTFPSDRALVLLASLLSSRMSCFSLISCSRLVLGSLRALLTSRPGVLREGHLESSERFLPPPSHCLRLPHLLPEALPHLSELLSLNQQLHLHDHRPSGPPAPASSPPSLSPSHSTAQLELSSTSSRPLVQLWPHLYLPERFSTSHRPYSAALDAFSEQADLAIAPGRPLPRRPPLPSSQLPHAYSLSPWRPRHLPRELCYLIPANASSRAHA